MPPKKAARIEQYDSDIYAARLNTHVQNAILTRERRRAKQFRGARLPVGDATPPNLLQRSQTLAETREFYLQSH